MALRRSAALVAASLLSAAASTHGGPPATRPVEALPFDPARHWRTRDVRPGMTGYGLSVFRGTAIERFDVEVISVLNNQDGPDHDVILIRCHGQGLEHSGAVEGMSGSPIYLTDSAGHARLAGAFALGWENSKDPIAGVRPIEEMLRVPTGLVPDAVPSATTKVDRSAWNAVPLLRPFYGSIDDRPGSHGRPARDSAAEDTGGTPVPPDARTSRLHRLSLPLSVAGIGPAGFDRLAPLLRTTGLVPLEASAAAAGEVDAKAKLEPGAAIGLPIVTGDLDVAAIGTVTEVIGDKLYAFGHEFNSEGAVDLPMGLGYIHTVIPASTISFKMGSIVRLDGAIHSDESTAIAGRIGATPAMIPVTVAVRTPQRADEKTYRFRVARHPKFTPMGVVAAVTAAIAADSGLPADFTVRYTLKLSFDNGRTLDLSDTTTSADKSAQLSRDLNLPLTLALHNPFGKAYPTAIAARFEVVPRVTLDGLKSAVTDKRIYRPGETVNVFVTTQAYDGDAATRHVSLDLPDDTPEGDYTLTVGDAGRALADATRDAPYRYQARDLDEVFGIVKEATGRPSQRLYLRLASQGEAVSVGRTPLQGLPASRVKLLAKASSADVLPFVPAVTQTAAWPSPLKGSADVMIRVSRTPETAPRPADEPPAGDGPAVKAPGSGAGGRPTPP